MHRPTHATVAAYLALFTALGGSAYAVTSSTTSGSIISACYSKQTGALRVLIGDRCKRTERLLSWNRRGPRGTVDASRFFTKTQSDTRFAQASLFGHGVTPSQGTGSDGSCIVGEVKLMAGNQLPSDWALADGRSLSISDNTALYSLLGTTYGGDGKTTFDLPNLQAADPKGRGPASPAYAVCLYGTFP